MSSKSILLAEKKTICMQFFTDAELAPSVEDLSTIITFCQGKYSFSNVHSGENIDTYFKSS